MHDVSHYIRHNGASMTMDIGSLKIVMLGLGLCFALVIGESTDDKCAGPVSYYKDLGCIPEFENAGDCCPIRYNCERLKNLPSDKCVINDNVYEVGQPLREEDANPCDIGCFCAEGQGGPQFTCAIVDCFHGPVKPGCYRKNSPTNCCPGPEVCPEKAEDRPTCVVDGKTFRDGEYFTAAEDPNKSCSCGEGYTGQNIEPFCVTPKHAYCDALLRHADMIRENCAPIYYSSQSPQTSCSLAYRCQNDKDIVITNTQNDPKSATGETSDPNLMCTFGNLTMQVGDELNQATDYSSVCVKCVCEVPPLPTCQRLPDEECDVTKHPTFDRR